MACGAKRVIVSRHLNFLLLWRGKRNVPFALDFKLNGQVKMLRVARKVGSNTSKLLKENMLNGVSVQGRVDLKHGKRKELKRNI